MKKSLIIILLTAAVNMCVYAIPDERNAFLPNNEGQVTDIFDASYKESGEWEDCEFTGYDNMPVHISDGNSAHAIWNKNLDITGYVRVYYWKTILGDDGDTKALITCSSNATSLSKNIDFTSGYSGWVNLGVLDAADVFFELTVNGSGIGKVPVCAYKIVKVTKDDYIFDEFLRKNDEALVLMNNVSYAYKGGGRFFIPDSPPIIRNDRILLPVRFIAENMGCDVKWNGEENSVIINSDEHNVIFFVDKHEYYKDGEIKYVDCAPEIVSGRTMLPLRVLAESIGRDVLWDDTGVVIICENISMSEKDRIGFYAAAKNIFEKRQEE